MPSREPENVRPTLRCLTEDLGLELPTVDQRLHELEVPIVARAQLVPAKQHDNGAERILCLKDRVWLKAKTERDRGAVTEYIPITDLDAVRQFTWWLGAVGYREAGSDDDAYEMLAQRSQVSGASARSRIDTTWMLPVRKDVARANAEHAYAELDAMNRQIRALIAESTRSGKTLTTIYGAHSLEVRVRAQDHITYLAVGMTGVHDYREIAALLSCVPGVSPDDWAPEPGDVLGIEPRCGQVVFAAILEPQVLNSILDESPSGSLEISD